MGEKKLVVLRYFDLKRENERLRTALKLAILAIESLPEEILGVDFHGGTEDNPDYHFIKDELLDNLHAALCSDPQKRDGDDE